MRQRERRERRERAWALRFFAVTGAIWLGTSAIFGALVVNWTQSVSIAQFGLMVFFLFSFAWVFTRRLFSLVLPPFRLPALDRLSRRPRVAILYTTMNDVVPDCVRAIRQEYPCDVFLLDDSSDPAKRDVVDRLAAEMGFRVLRRTNREGFKAGAINHWLRLHGSTCDYFVLLDADSVLPRDWVARALRYAEHPENADLAIFQGMINIWNTDGSFAKTLAQPHVISHDEWERKMAGYLGAVVCYGHNVLIRTKPVLDLGGFDERYVSEDFATAVALASRGHGSTFVPLHSWEALPENVRGFVRRQNKWTRSSMEFFTFVPSAKLPLHKKMMLLTIPWGHLAYVAIMLAVFLAVFGRLSSFTAFVAFGRNLASAPLEYIWSIPLFRFLIVLSVITSCVSVAKIVQVRLSFMAFYRARRLSRAIGALMLPHEVRSMAMYVIDRRRRFPVTPKDEPPMTMREILSLGRGTVVLIAFVTAGLAIVNPIGLYYNILWLVPFFTSPAILHHYCGPRAAARPMANGGSRDLLTDPRLRTALDRPPYQVPRAPLPATPVAAALRKPGNEGISTATETPPDDS
ncbi:MAG TPA: glycosyltransferase family 2 protein [Thermoplasmata archaeon]|nr:glycosyltransferase family 2 protein [Thermoplasmata archaeon]